MAGALEPSLELRSTVNLDGVDGEGHAFQEPVQEARRRGSSVDLEDVPAGDDVPSGEVVEDRRLPQPKRALGRRFILSHDDTILVSRMFLNEHTGLPDISSRRAYHRQGFRPDGYHLASAMGEPRHGEIGVFSAAGN